jgi:Peptidase MA superfamily
MTSGGSDRRDPRSRSRARLPGRLLAVLLAALLGSTALATAAAPEVRAAGAVTFAAPTASGTLGTAVTFQDTFTSASQPSRVELLTVVPGFDTALVTPASVSPGTGAGRYTAQVADTEHIIPNTTIEYHFRVTAADGSVSDGPGGSITIVDTRYSWHTLMGKVVRLHWYQGDSAFAHQALTIGDDAVARVSKLLGVTETKPIDFFIYSSAQGLDGALGPGTSEFVAGRAVPEIRTLFAEIDPSQIGSSWVSIVIPHELTHLVFDTATHNPVNQPPLWLNEGLAVYESQGNDSADQQRLQAAVSSGTVIPLLGLGGQFPQRQTLFYLSYAEGVSAVAFFIKTYGQPKLVALIRSYAKGVTDDEAFQAATGGDLASFQASWLRYIGAAAPKVYGPRPAPAGLTPPGWTGVGAAMGSGATPAPGQSAVPSAAPSAGASSPASGAGGAPSLAEVAAIVLLGILFIGGLLLIRRDRQAAS